MAATAISASHIACEFIAIYQRYISPRKGFRCAYGAQRGRWSCSEFGKRAIARAGLWAGALLIRRRFAKCHAAAKRVLDYEAPRPKEAPSPIAWTTGDELACCLGELAAEAFCSLVTSGF